MARIAKLHATEAAHDASSTLEEAVLDLARAGFTVQRALDETGGDEIVVARTDARLDGRDQGPFDHNPLIGENLTALGEGVDEKDRIDAHGSDFALPSLSL